MITWVTHNLYDIAMAVIVTGGIYHFWFLRHKKPPILSVLLGFIVLIFVQLF